jgi:predicted AAA+ superfamily ATPase
MNNIAYICIFICIKMINRIIEAYFTSFFETGKFLIVFSPRKTGATTLLRKIQGDAIWLDCEEPGDRGFLRNATPASIKSQFGNSTKVIIDQAQRIENLRSVLELITTTVPDIQLYAIVTSPYKISIDATQNSIGRNADYLLLPLSYEEMSIHHGDKTEKDSLEMRLIYGYYPEVVSAPGDKGSVVKQLVSNYLYKDILMWERIQKPESFEGLLQLLALQVGQIISNNKLGEQLGLSGDTIEKYIQLLENALIVFRLNGLSGNLKNELTKSSKIYFYDIGIRNAILDQFSPISLRDDKDKLWENFIIAERRKFLNNHSINANSYFWRTKDRAEVDYIEELNGKISAVEFRFSPAEKARFSKSFVNTYLPSEMHIVHQENFQEWIIETPGNTIIINKNKPWDTPRNQDFSLDFD